MQQKVGNNSVIVLDEIRISPIDFLEIICQSLGGNNLVPVVLQPTPFDNI